MSPAAEPPEEEVTPGRISGPWWYTRRRRLGERQRRELLGELFFEGPELVPFLRRFTALLLMAVLIASFGLAQDSTPVVIGAMLISPLTTPILGLAAALVLGHPRRQLNSFLILAGGSLAGVAAAAGVMMVLPEAAAVTLASEQLLARTEPGLLDLAVALVAGSAGAYVLVRRESISVLPGVAIAVALVPPLATIGITLELGRTDLADGAILLYLTNLAGIVLSSAVVMLVLGISPDHHEGRLPRRVRVGLASAGVAALLIAAPLVEHTRQEIHDANDTAAAKQLADEWVEGTGLAVRSVQVIDDERVLIEVAGPRRPPALDGLAAQLADELAEPVEVEVSWTRAETTVATASP